MGLRGATEPCDAVLACTVYTHACLPGPAPSLKYLRLVAPVRMQKINRRARAMVTERCRVDSNNGPELSHCVSRTRPRTRGDPRGVKERRHFKRNAADSALDGMPISIERAGSSKTKHDATLHVGVNRWDCLRDAVATVSALTPRHAPTRRHGYDAYASAAFCYGICLLTYMFVYQHTSVDSYCIY